jgi:hypothetical protein
MAARRTLQRGDGPEQPGVVRNRSVALDSEPPDEAAEHTSTSPASFRALPTPALVHAMSSRMQMAAAAAVAADPPSRRTASPCVLRIISGAILLLRMRGCMRGDEQGVSACPPSRNRCVRPQTLLWFALIG